MHMTNDKTAKQLLNQGCITGVLVETLRNRGSGEYLHITQGEGESGMLSDRIRVLSFAFTLLLAF